LKSTGPTTSVLRGLEIKIAPKESEQDRAFKRFSSILHESISRCESTLKHLVISVPEKYSKDVTAVLDLHRASPKLRLTTFQWNLSRSNETDFSLEEDEANTLLEFLKNQDQLKDVLFPTECSLVRLWCSVQMIDSITSNVERFGSKCGVLTSTMLEKFSKLKALSFNSVNPICLARAAGKNIYPELRFLDILGVTQITSPPRVLPPAPAGFIVSYIARTFPNLTSLCIRPDTSDVPDSYTGINRDLQIIIQNLLGLRSLVLGYFDGLTDFGVTGIQDVDCQELMKTKDIYMKRNLSEFEMYRSGLPLSSLKCK